MPRQNRVTPFGDLIATPEHGTFMGNRGRLHNEGGRIRRAWQVKRWLVCVLEFRGRRRQVMRPGYYTELFFLDEATALASGHRPCAECRRERYNAFRRAWPGAGLPAAGEIDGRLHAERLTAGGAKRTHTANIALLPDGVFVRNAGGNACLVLGDALLPWSAGGYTARLARPWEGRVEVLTPASTVKAIRAGYVPVLHPSATT
jgi:hypothetical protein